MPYPKAPYYVLFVLAVIAVGFWPSYFAKWNEVPWQFHAHGVAASLWVTMVLTQSWTAHHKQFELHRATGKASLLLFPFLIAGFAGIIDVTGKGYVAANDPVRVMFGGAFLLGLAIAVGAYVTFYYRALKYRRKVWVHSGYMLATPLFLFESPFSRIMGTYIPAFMVKGPQDFPLIMTTILLSMALELIFIAVICVKFRNRAAPFMVAAGFIVAQMITMGLLGDWPVLRPFLVLIGQAPSSAVWLTGFVIGALTSWAGWNAGKSRSAPVGMAQAMG
jgi:hypothetical protein